MRIRVTTPPTQIPVTLADCYSQLRLDPSGSPPTHPDDAMLTRLIGAATNYAEQATRRALCKQSIQLTHSRFPYDRVFFAAQQTLWSEPDGYDWRPRHIRILRPNLLTLTSIQYHDQQNSVQTLDPTLYLVHSDEQEATVEMLEGNFWPITYLREDAVQLNYDAGYTPTSSGSPPVFDYAANVPEGIKQAMLLHVQIHYDPAMADITQMWWNTIDSLLGSYRSFNF